jgi:hypothetical protein
MSNSCFEFDIESTIAIPQFYRDLKNNLLKNKESIDSALTLQKKFDHYSKLCKKYCDEYHKSNNQLKCMDFLPYEFFACIRGSNEFTSEESVQIPPRELDDIKILYSEFIDFISYLQKEHPQSRIFHELSKKKIHEVYTESPTNFTYDTGRKGGKRKSKRKNRRMKTKRTFRKQRISRKKYF